MQGDFLQTDKGPTGADCSNHSYKSQSNHVLRLAGDLPQLVTFETPHPTTYQASRVQHLDVSAGADVTLSTDVPVVGSATVDGGVTVSAGTTWSIGGQLTASHTATIDNQGTITAGSCNVDAAATLVGPEPCP